MIRDLVGQRDLLYKITQQTAERDEQVRCLLRAVDAILVSEYSYDPAFERYTDELFKAIQPLRWMIHRD